MIEERYYAANSEKKFKIILVGDPYVGKTALFWRYTHGEFLVDKPATVTTIDFKIKEVLIQTQPVKLYIWDTAGQEKYRSIVSTYFKGCDGIILVFDLSNPASFTSVTTKWFEMARSKSPDSKLVLVGNKSDLEIGLDEKQPELWARDHGAVYIRTSVKRDINVGECFRRLSEMIYR